MSYIENRVYVRDFGTLPVGSPLLVPVPTTAGHKQQYIHKAVLPNLLAMFAAGEADLGFPFLVASGHRPPLWNSRADYEADMIKQYGSVAEGQKWRAFASAHQTGLAFDFGCGGLSPVSKTIPQQKETPLYAWIVENAYKWGWHPYSPEPWHLEDKIPFDLWQSGEPPEPVTTPNDPNDVCVEWVTAPTS
jgi:D-alanyl-D-alanine carboxypeptidase